MFDLMGWVKQKSKERRSKWSPEYFRYKVHWFIYFKKDVVQKEILDKFNFRSNNFVLGHLKKLEEEKKIENIRGTLHSHYKPIVFPSLIADVIPTWALLIFTVIAVCLFVWWLFLIGEPDIVYLGFEEETVKIRYVVPYSDYVIMIMFGWIGGILTYIFIGEKTRI